MATDLKPFKEAYATMTVATYEPLILRWISLLGVRFIAHGLADRYAKARYMKADHKLPTVMAMNRTMRRALPASLDLELKADTFRVPIDIHGRAIDPSLVKQVKVDGHPDAVAMNGAVYLDGVTETDPHNLAKSAHGTLMEKIKERAGLFSQGLKRIPILTSRRMGRRTADLDQRELRHRIESSLFEALAKWEKGGEDPELMTLLSDAAQFDGIRLPHFWPVRTYEFLSPIGVAHFYRQLFFNLEEGVGPLEQAFTIAPLETLEVMYQTVRRQVHEEILEQGLEVVSESATEEKNLDEISDKVSSMVQQDASASMSANASGGIGVWQVGASASASLSTSSQNSREATSRRMKEMTKRASERITKSFTLKTHDLQETTTTDLTRRVIRNDSEHPVSYGLRRVLRRVRVKVQDLGPSLVWQVYLRNPGEGLACSRFVHFREAAPIAPPEIPPGCPPRPIGGSETGATSSAFYWDGTRNVYFVTIVINAGNDRDVTAVRIDSITDIGGGGKDDVAPAAANDIDCGSTWDPATRTYTARIGVVPGDSQSAQVNYSFTWEPSQAAMDAWETLRQAAVAAITEDALTKQFEQHKLTITERSKIKSRPANDLRKEERYEVMNRMISYLFGRGDDPSEPTPLEIEQFHRYFDIEGLFTYNHPSWWKPRFAAGDIGFGREAYEVTADSEPAALGRSLGWLIQLDGDRRRNEFLNSAWARVCLPMRRGVERQAIQWLARHLEGERGYNDRAGVLSNLIDEVEAIRAKEKALGVDGADYVNVDSTVGAPADPQVPEGVYPIVNEFDVTVPTDGFVYDELNLIMA